MAEKTLIANIQEDDNDPDTLLVTSPVVGMADGAPEVWRFAEAMIRDAAKKGHLEAGPRPGEAD